MTRKALDPNLASILDSIRATVGAETPLTVREVEVEEPEEAIDVEASDDQQPDAPAEPRPAKAAKPGRKAAPVPPGANRSVEEFLADLVRPQVEAWLNAHLPELVQKMAAEEIARLTGKK
jgi:cell pole-organizing protein PopZ